eukprot:6571288-Pyramimonas_sp.AAC.1
MPAAGQKTSMLRSRTRLRQLGSNLARENGAGFPIFLETYACPASTMVDCVTFFNAGAVAEALP